MNSKEILAKLIKIANNQQKIIKKLAQQNIQKIIDPNNVAKAIYNELLRIDIDSQAKLEPIENGGISLRKEGSYQLYVLTFITKQYLEPGSPEETVLITDIKSALNNLAAENTLGIPVKDIQIKNGNTEII